MPGPETTQGNDPDPVEQTGTGDTATDQASNVDATLNEIYDRYEEGRPGAAQEGAMDKTGNTERVPAEGRDASGRFKSAQTSVAVKTAAPDPAAAVKAGAVDPATGKPAATQEIPATGEQPQTLQAPDAWRAEWKEQFGKLPPEAKTLLSTISTELQADYTRKTQSLAGERKRYEVLNTAIAPIEAEAKKFNVSTDAAINGMWAIHAGLLNPETRLHTIKQLAEDYDVDLTAAQNVTLQPRQQPAAAALSPELEARLADVEGQLKTGRENEHASIVRRDTAIAQTWGDEKGQDGTPLRPHLRALLGSMQPLIYALRQGSPDVPFVDLLQRAYEAACAADPVIRQKMIDDLAAAQVAEKIGKDRTRGTKAAQASSAQVSRNGASRARQADPADVDSKLSEIWEKNYGSGTA